MLQSVDCLSWQCFYISDIVMETIPEEIALFMKSHTKILRGELI